jgi:hypothetical protein
MHHKEGEGNAEGKGEQTCHVAAERNVEGRREERGGEWCWGDGRGVIGQEEHFQFTTYAFVLDFLLKA